MSTNPLLLQQFANENFSSFEGNNYYTKDNWLHNNLKWLISILIVLLEIFLRVAPTNKDWSIVNKILSILIWIFNIIPNNAKLRNDVLKRGHDIRIKKIIDSYKNAR